MYDELITDRWGTRLNGDTPWVIVFLRDDQVDNRRAMTHYKAMAPKYEGRVRFAYVLRSEEELLSESFGVKQLPFTIFIKDGVAYWYRDFAYESALTRYIETGGWVNSTTEFKQPARFFPIQLYLYSYPR